MERKIKMSKKEKLKCTNCEKQLILIIRDRKLKVTNRMMSLGFPEQTIKTFDNDYEELIEELKQEIKEK